MKRPPQLSSKYLDYKSRQNAVNAWKIVLGLEHNNGLKFSNAYVQTVWNVTKLAEPEVPSISECKNMNLGNSEVSRKPAAF